jgi:Virus neck protein
MPTSPYFDHQPNKPNPEQLLLEDMLNEQIYLMGYDVYYLLRESLDDIDMILGEDPNSIFQKAYKVCAFINDVENWSAGGDFFSKFGFQINKQNSIVLTKRHFNRWVGNAHREKPIAGDLIYIPVFEKLFEIKKVSSDAPFYVLGSRDPFYFNLELEMFKYSHEPITTGIEELDILEKENAYVLELNVTGGNTPYWNSETVYQGNSLPFARASAVVKYWDRANSKIGVYNVIGEFETGNSVIGMSSGAVWNVSTYDSKQDNEEFRLYQNKEIEVSANTTIVRTENNPFGRI